MLVLKSEIQNSQLRISQAIVGLLSINHRTKAISVMKIRSSLREKLQAGHIDLRRFMRSMGSLSSKIDSHAKYVIQCARNEAEEQVPENSTDAERHILASVSEEPNLLVRGRGRRACRVRGLGQVSRKLCAKCGKDFSASYLARHIVICKGQRTTHNQPTADQPTSNHPIANPTSTPLDYGDEGNVFFSFDIEDAINGETEITLSQINQDVFLLEESLAQAGPSVERQLELYGVPRQHNRYGSGDLSDQLVDDFGLPIYRVVTRSMSRSSQ